MYTSETQRYLRQLISWKSEKYSIQLWASADVVDLNRNEKLLELGPRKGRCWKNELLWCDAESFKYNGAGRTCKVHNSKP